MISISAKMCALLDSGSCEQGHGERRLSSVSSHLCCGKCCSTWALSNQQQNKSQLLLLLKQQQLNMKGKPTEGPQAHYR